MKTTVAPKIFHGRTTIDIEGGEAFYLAAHADPDVFLVQAKSQQSDSLVGPIASVNFTKNSKLSDTLWFDSTFNTENGHSIKASPSDATGSHWSDASSGLVSGGKWYPMEFSIDGSATFTVTNTGSSPLTTQLTMYAHTASGTELKYTSNVTTNAHGHNSATFSVSSLDSSRETVIS